MGGVLNDFITHSVIDEEGNIYMTGRFSGVAYFGKDSLLSAGNSDVFLVKMDPNGDVEWARRAGVHSADEGKRVVVTQSAVYVLGNFRDFANFSNPYNYGENQILSLGGNDFFIAKYLKNGTFVWAQTIGGAGTESVHDLAIFGESVLISGAFNQAAVLKSSQPQNNQYITSNGGLDFYLAKYNHNGVLDWVVSGGGPNEDVSNSLCVTPTEILICGNFSNTLQFFDQENNPILEVISSGFSDIFLASYGYDGAFKWGRRDGGTSIDFGMSVLKYKNDLFCLGNFNLFTRFGEEFGIYDIAGKCLSNGKIFRNSFFVDVTIYSSGVYIFKTSKRRMKGIQFIKL